jgi:hypothetical protein
MAETVDLEGDSSSHAPYYQRISNGMVCGDNTWPSNASKMRTTR